jgi:hypothetical protein
MYFGLCKPTTSHEQLLHFRFVLFMDFPMAKVAISREKPPNKP